MRRIKSNIGRHNRDAQRARVRRSKLSEEQISARQAAQRIKMAETRRRESPEEREERLRQNKLRNRERRNRERERMNEMQRIRRALKRGSLVHHAFQPAPGFESSSFHSRLVKPGLTNDVLKNDTDDFLTGSSRLKKEPDLDSMNEEEHLCPTTGIDTTTYIKQEDESYIYSPIADVDIKVEPGFT